MTPTQWKDICPYPFDKLVNKLPIAFDTETAGYTKDTNLVVYYSWCSDDTGCGAASTLTKEGMRFFKALCSSDRPKVCHNLKADLNFCKYTGIDLLGPYHDTRLMLALVDEYSVQQVLRDVEEQFLGRKRPNGKRIADWRRKCNSTIPHLYIPQELIHEDATQDAQATWDLFKLFALKLKELGIVSLYQQEVQVELVYWEMHRRGQLIDKERVDRVILELDEPLEELKRQIQEVFGDINPNSAIQLREALLKAGVPLHKLTKVDAEDEEDGKVGNLATDKRALVEFTALPGIPALLGYKRLVQAQRMLRQYQTRADKDNLLHTEFNQLTLPGRTSSSNPCLMNIPKSAAKVKDVEVGELMLGDLKIAQFCSEKVAVVREVFISRPGSLLVSQDFKQGEYRVFTHYTNSPRLINFLQDPKADFHHMIGTTVLGDKYDDTYRNLIKILNFGRMYGMGDRAVADLLRPYIANPEQFINIVDQRLPEMKEFQSRILYEVTNSGYVRDVFGRYYRLDHKRPYTAIAHICAGTLANVKKRSLVRINRILGGDGRKSPHDPRTTRSGLQIDVHDDLIPEIYPEDAHLLFKVRDAMIDCPELQVPMATDISVGTSLGKMQKFNTLEEAVNFVANWKDPRLAA